jgi:ABC transport system ATP-binding/permease protein
LQDYEGTVFLVSHDRSFLDNVVTSTIAFEGDGTWREYEGGVTDWLVQSKRRQEASAVPAAARPKAERKPEPTSPPARRKLSYKEQRELEALPALIDALEQEQRAIQEELSDGGLYRDDPPRAAQLAERVAAIEDELMAALERWEHLGAV